MSDEAPYALKVQRVLQRLDARGDLTVKLEMRGQIHREWTERGWTDDERKLTIVGHTEWNQASVPTWVVSMHRARDAYGPARRSGSAPWVWELMGWGTFTAENTDLLAALEEVLDRSEPQRVYLDERVWEHVDFVRMCDLHDGFVGVLREAS